MAGYFDGIHPYIDIEVSGIFESKKTIKAQIDTGYSGYLTLSYAEAFPLGLVLSGTKAYTIADGSTMYNLVALGTVVCERKRMVVSIDISPKSSILIGMQLLIKLGGKMKIDFEKKKLELKPKRTVITPKPVVSGKKAKA